MIKKKTIFYLTAINSRVKNGLFLCCLLTIIFSSCSDKGQSEACHFVDYKSIPSARLDYSVFNLDTLVINEDNEPKYMLSEIDKIIYQNGSFFLSDWRHGKVVCFDRKGSAVLAITKRGRGPQEYLKISDFDVDHDHRIFIMDGQSDRLLVFDKDGSFIHSLKLPIEAYAFKTLSKGGYIFNLAPWTKGDGEGDKIIVTDDSLKLLSHNIEYNGIYDSGFSFSSVVFTNSNSFISFNQPIDDNVYVFDNDGNHLITYLFDFGAATVPTKIRKSIEANLSDLEEYSFITNAVYADEHHIIGTLMDKGAYRDFIIDLDNNIKYLQDIGSNIRLRTVSNGYAIFQDLNNCTTLLVGPVDCILSAISQLKH